MSDYIPNRDNDFMAWLNSFMTYATQNMAALGLAADDMTALGAAIGDFSSALNSHGSARYAAQGARQTKDAARMTAEQVLRRYVKDLQNRPSVTDEQRTNLGIRVRDTQATEGSLSSLEAPTRPLLLVDNTRRLIQRVRFVEEGQPTRRARPDGVKGVEIWTCTLPAGSAAPADQTAMQYVDTPSSGPLELTFAAAEAGKVAWYLARWVANSGAKGEWSNMASAMILG